MRIHYLLFVVIVLLFLFSSCGVPVPIDDPIKFQIILVPNQDLSSHEVIIASITDKNMILRYINMIKESWWVIVPCKCSSATLEGQYKIEIEYNNHSKETFYVGTFRLYREKTHKYYHTTKLVNLVREYFFKYLIANKISIDITSK